MAFADIAAPWRAAGWLGTIPLPECQKFPPPTGYTGKANRTLFASDSQMARWSGCAEYRNANIGIALGFPVVVDGIEYEVLALDADQYDDGGKSKRGGDQLAAMESELGPLPPTWVSTARARNDDGTDRGDWISGIRFYLVPVGLTWPGKAAKTAPDVDVIQKAHRYAVVWPSFNPKSGTTYRLYSPTEWAAHGQPSGEVPDPASLPLLPDAWIDRLTQNRMRDSPRPIDTDSSLGELEAWALNQFQDPDVMCERVATQLAKRKELIADNADSHNQLLLGHMEFVHLAAEGHTGWLTAINETTEFWIQDVSGREKRDYGVMRREIFRELTGALRKKKRQNGSRHLGRTLCTCSKTVESQRNTMDNVVQCLAGVEPTTVEWLWRPWIPLGKLTILEGESGVAKSTMTMDWAAIVSQGKAWPVTAVNGVPQSIERAEPAGVVLVGIEDDAEDTIVPRLIAAGADRSRVFTMTQPIDDNGDPVPFVIPEDVNRLRRAIELTNARLVIIDPITAFLSTKQVKPGDDPSTRQALMPLVNIAREMRCAIVLIRHLNKSSGQDAKHRGSGSMAYTALARSVVLAGKLKETDDGGATHAIARTKGNLSRDPDALGYVLKDAPGNPDISTMNWVGSLDMNADQLAGADSAKDGRKAAPVREQAEDAIRLLLANGPMSAGDAIDKACEKIGCSERTVRKAADSVGVLKERVYIDGKMSHWTWELPPVFIPLHKKSDVDAESGSDED